MRCAFLAVLGGDISTAGDIIAAWAVLAQAFGVIMNMILVIEVFWTAKRKKKNEEVF